MKGTIRQMYLKSLRALMLAEARLVDMLLLGISLIKWRFTFNDVDVTTGQVVSECLLTLLATSLLPGFEHRVVSVVLR